MVLNSILNIPPITRLYLIGCIVCTLLNHLEYFTTLDLIFNTTLILRGQIWRLFSSFFFHTNFGLFFLLRIWIIYADSSRLEVHNYHGKPADYLYSLLFGMLLLILMAPFTGIYLLSISFTEYIMYVWSRKNSGIQVLIFGFLQLRACWVPWVFIGFHCLVVGMSAFSELLAGILIGHVYIYFADIYPKLMISNRKSPLATPAILRRIGNKFLQYNGDYDEDFNNHMQQRLEN